MQQVSLNIGQNQTHHKALLKFVNIFLLIISIIINRINLSLCD
jgi:hypothetical protein